MERETLDVDILIVGGGPAGLSAALRLSQLQAERGGDRLSIAVLEKAREVGAHSLSGAVLDPSALAALLPDFRERGAPLEAEVGDDRVCFLTRRRAFRLPITPPPLRNHGHYVVSLNRLVRWLAGQVEAAGIDLFTGFPATEVVLDGNRVTGVRIGDRGVGRDGRPRSDFEPGAEITAKVTIIADGVRGNLTKQLLARFPLAEGREPEQYSIGLKELWEVPPDRLAPGTVVHTLGYPLGRDAFGGGFVYAMAEGRLSVGLVVGLDYRDPLFDPYTAFQRFKQHPLVRRWLDGGRLVKFGAKALPEGGWNTIPRSYLDGALIAGDAGGYLNSFRLKGIHLAMRTGMLAAEAAFDAVRSGDWSHSRLKQYEEAIHAGPVRAELYPVRNVHQAFGDGLLAGLGFSALTVLTGGVWPGRIPGHAGHERMRKLSQYYRDGVPLEPSGAVRPDRVLTFDRLTSVHYSGTRHDENQPVHLRVQTDVCHTTCGTEYGYPCLRFCPAHVYEMVPAPDGSGLRLQINASNCVHCKTCDIMDPYQVITWVPPEGGDGPQYDGL